MKHTLRSARLRGLLQQPLVRVWLWSLLALAMAIGSMATDTILAPLLMWGVLAVLLHGALTASPNLRGLRDWRQ
jgi:hypothetical protein